MSVVKQHVQRTMDVIDGAGVPVQSRQVCASCQRTLRVALCWGMLAKPQALPDWYLEIDFCDIGGEESWPHHGNERLADESDTVSDVVSAIFAYSACCVLSTRLVCSPR